jgi:glycosidase
LEKQRQAEKSFFKFYQQLSSLRTTDDFKYGNFTSKAYDNDVFVFERAYEGHSSIVVINFGNLNHTIDVNAINTREVKFPEKLRVVVAGSRSSK